MSCGFPELTPRYLRGLDVLYTGLNDVHFYVEDEFKENLYYQILRKFYPEMDIKKIFPLGGKPQVIEHARNNEGTPGKVFIVDTDFDEILGSKVICENLFYLDGYSIENLLIDEVAIMELAREKSPNAKSASLREIVRTIDFKSDYRSELISLNAVFCAIMAHGLKKKFFKLNFRRDTDRESDPKKITSKELDRWETEVDTALKVLDGRYSLRSKSKVYREHFQKHEDRMANVHGKLLLTLVHGELRSQKAILRMTLEQFTYKLAQQCNPARFSHLISSINAFLT